MSREGDSQKDSGSDDPSHMKLSTVGKISFDDTGSISSINQYQIVKPLGKGSFAEVFLCHDRKAKLDYAVKIFNKSLLRRKRRMERTAKGVHVHSELDKVCRLVFSQAAHSNDDRSSAKSLS